MSSTIIHSARQLVTCAGGGPKRGAAMRDVGIIEDGAVVIEGEQMVAVGSTADILARYTADRQIDASGKVVCPGFVDAHTHAVYAGNRIDEFEMRIQGASYMAIMAAGGGIASTMRATRAASLDELVAQSLERLGTMLWLGTTTVEIKTGYGLDAETELKMLRVIEQLAQSHPVDIVPTFLGAHAIPPEYRDAPDAYVDRVIHEMLPAAARWYQDSFLPALAKAGRGDAPFYADVFCEGGVFSVEQSERIWAAARAYGMGIKAHVDEFKSLRGVTAAVRAGAVSVDHLDVTPSAEIGILAASDTIGVILPAVNFNLGSTHYADARALLDAGVALALATDLNPGSAPCPSMPLVMAIACRYQKLLPAEALNASTINAAYAIGMGERVGSIEAGKQADLLILNAPDYRCLMAQFGENPVEQVMKRGLFLEEL
jgi:imidazolonepropionase